MPEKITDEDLELLGDLGVESEPEQAGGKSAREQRIIAGFEEIERFVVEHGRLPQHGESLDIFERLYAVRLDRLRASEECREVLRHRDPHGLLGLSLCPRHESLREDATEYRINTSTDAEPSDAELLAELGVADLTETTDIFELKHVRSREEIRAAEEVAQRNPCADFELFRPVFDQVQQDLDAGKRQTLKYKDNADVKKGDLFVLDRQTALVAEVGEIFMNEHGRPDSRLRVVFDNGTDSDLLMRSLQRALNKDKASRRITEPELGPLFTDELEEDDLPAGYIYVLRSKSDHPFVNENRLVLHKIGVTGGDIRARIANARKDPTYLMAEVELVTTFKLANINRKLLEGLLHRFFASARLDLELKDRFGFQVEPREWFLVPLTAIEDAIKKLKEGSIANFRYDVKTARIVQA